jgi:predicted ester cyclase
LSDNIEIITRFEHEFRAGDQATIDELCVPGLVDHNPAPDHEPTLADFKQKVAGFRAVFPDLEADLQDIIASGDTVATRWVVTGSLQQEFMGIPASGQTVRVDKDGLAGWWTRDVRGDASEGGELLFHFGGPEPAVVMDRPQTPAPSKQR